MDTKKSTLRDDILCALQVLLSWIFTIPQVIRSFRTTDGMTMTWPIFCTAFVLVNLSLAVGQYKESRSRKALQIAAVYANFLVLWVAMLIPACLYGTWRRDDTIVSLIILITLTVLLVARWRNTFVGTITEPITRGWVSLIVKSVPQVFIGYRIVAAGSNEGLAGLTLIIGHLTVCLRILEVYFAAKQDGMTDKNKGILISEVGNELTWWITTFAWLAYWR